MTDFQTYERMEQSRDEHVCAYCDRFMRIGKFCLTRAEGVNPNMQACEAFQQRKAK